MVPVPVCAQPQTGCWTATCEWSTCPLPVPAEGSVHAPSWEVLERARPRLVSFTFLVPAPFRLVYVSCPPRFVSCTSLVPASPRRFARFAARFARLSVRCRSTEPLLGCAQRETHKKPSLPVLSDRTHRLRTPGRMFSRPRGADNPLPSTDPAGARRPSGRHARWLLLKAAALPRVSCVASALPPVLLVLSR